MKEDTIPFELERLLYGLPPDLYYLEMVIRIMAIFAILLFTLRVLGKRGQKNLSPMQNILMISLGSAAGDAMFVPEIPLFYSAIVLTTVPLLILALQYFRMKFKPLEDYIKADPNVLVKNGELNTENMDKNRMTKREVYSQLRTKGVKYLEEVECMIFEPSGEMSVFKFENFIASDGETNLVDHIC